MKYILSMHGMPFSCDNVDILFVTRDSGFVNTSHAGGRKKAAFVFTVSGKIRYDFPTPDVPAILAGSGKALYVPKGTKYAGHFLEDHTVLKVLQFDLTENEAGSSPKIPLLCSGEKMTEIFSSLGVHGRNDSFGCLAAVYELFSLIMKGKDETLGGKYAKLRPALDEMEQHFDEKCKVSAYSGLCGMSEAGFRRLFAEYTGVSPIEYRNELRLSEARKLILSGEYSVSEAAELTGFDNLSFFYRMYRRRYGKAPKGK